MRRSLILLAAALGWLACSSPPTAWCGQSPEGSVAKVPFDSARLKEIDVVIEDSISRKECPGGVFLIERGGVQHVKSYGRRAIQPTSEDMTTDTLFDAASLTKVIATTPSVMLLFERGKIDLAAPLTRYFPTFTGEGRDAITVRHLLTHTSGLRPGIPKQPVWSGKEAGIALALHEKPETPPGSQFRYSDINFILLGELVAKVSAVSLDEFAQREIFKPLRMSDTGYLPAKNLEPRSAPTEIIEGTVLRGVVHDPTSRLMGGIAGHAGLFTTAADLARFARMLLNEGELDGVRLLKTTTVRQMISVQTPASLEARRGLGWDIDTSYSRPRGRVFPLGSYGHTGFTGTCVWIDPFSRTFWIFLSNRVHPDGKGNILQLQTELGTLVAQSVVGFDFELVRGALSSTLASSVAHPAPIPQVLNGIDVLARDGFKILQGMKVGLVSNHTGHDSRRRTSIDLLFKAPGVKLMALFSPEHGIRGEADEKVADGHDIQTGLPIYSLYGERRSPTVSQLAGLDVIVFDIQDIGTRYYTYLATLGNCMEAASKSGLKFVVLDRVNPINGVTIEGPVHTNASTFVAYHGIPLRHGMTVGELARMFREERGWTLDLMVVPLEGWKRSMWFDETGLPWTNPSPNMRSMAGAALYPALGFHEAALAVGRGTDSPFQWVGAPYADELLVAEELRKAALPGLRFAPIQFIPNYSTFKGRRCGGVAITIVDREAMRAVDLGIEIARVFQRLYPKDYSLEKVVSLLTDEPTLTGIRSGMSLSQIKAGWEKELENFQNRRRAYLIY